MNRTIRTAGKYLRGILLGLMSLLCAVTPTAAVPCAATAEPAYIKWMSFDVPYSALSKSMQIDIRSHTAGQPVNWVELLAYLGTRYGGNWKKYRAKDMDALVSKLKAGQTMAELTAGMKNYAYYYETTDAVLGNFVGEYRVGMPSEGVPSGSVADAGGTRVEYGLKSFSPIARGYSYCHYDDFGDSRSFGFRRPHLGNDLMGSVGTPIVAVEGGTVESLGWNRYGGWRVGIRSFDRRRYYYYAHLRKGHPYAKGLTQGQTVHTGDVIGYLGMTGYSNKENVNNMQKPHLHFGMQIIFDESQKEGNHEIWIDVYDIVDLLASHRMKVVRDNSTKDYFSAYPFTDLRYPDAAESSFGNSAND